MNHSNLAKNWLQYTLNRVTKSTTVINSAFLSATVATPIESVHSMQSLMHTDHELSVHRYNNMCWYISLKCSKVNNARDMLYCLVPSHPLTEM